MKVSNATHVSASGSIKATGGIVRGVIVTAGSDAASATIKAGGSSGTVKLVVKAAAGATGSPGYLGDVAVEDSIYVTVTGTTPDITVIWE